MSTKPAPIPVLIDLSNPLGKEAVEGPVSSETFLTSFGEVAAWLRAIPAHTAIKTISDDRATQLERQAALTQFVQLAGAQFEDLTCLLIAMAAWVRGRDENIIDIFSRITLARSQKAQQATESYCENIIQKLRASSKAVRIDPAQFCRELAKKPSDEVIQLILGHKWSKQPSVKLVLEEDSLAWRHLPQSVYEIVSTLASETVGQVATLYNKAKHGPQVVVQDALRIARERRGYSQPRTDKLVHLLGPGPHVRFLFEGSRTQADRSEQESRRHIAPFAVCGTTHLEEYFYSVLVPHALLMRWLTQWQLRLLTRKKVTLDWDPSARRLWDAFDARSRARM